MSLKAVDPNDTYTVQRLFACGDGHYLVEPFTHWESGEVCPWGSHVNDPHLYYRDMMVPTHGSDGRPYAEHFAEQPGHWGHLPLAPKAAVA